MKTPSPVGSTLARRISKVACLGMLLWQCHACIPKLPDDFTTEESLYNYAIELSQHGSQEEALKFLNAYRNRYPLSERTPEVELIIAELHTKRGQYIEAVGMYQQFIQLHPTHPRLNYALISEGKAHMAQIPRGIDRDQNEVRLAIEKFQAVINDPTYGDEAKGLIQAMQLKLAQRDRYVADYYLKHKLWSAAEGRLVSLVENYNFDQFKQQALYDLVVIYLKLGSRNEAQRRFNDLQSLNANGSLSQQAQQLLDAPPAPSE